MCFTTILCTYIITLALICILLDMFIDIKHYLPLQGFYFIVFDFTASIKLNCENELSLQYSHYNHEVGK